MKPIHRGVVGLTEPGAATSAMVALTASQRAVAHYVSSGTIGIGTGRFGIRGTHLEPLADLTCPHILQESLPTVPAEREKGQRDARSLDPARGMAPPLRRAAQGGGELPPREGEPPRKKGSSQGVEDKPGGMDPAAAEDPGLRD